MPIAIDPVPVTVVWRSPITIDKAWFAVVSAPIAIDWVPNADESYPMAVALPAVTAAELPIAVPPVTPKIVPLFGSFIAINPTPAASPTAKFPVPTAKL